MDESRVEAWERRVEVPLLGLALAFLVAWAWPVLDPRLDPDVRTLLRTVSWTVWGAFAVDFAIRMTLARDRRRYARRHWYDVALILLPLLRPLRVLRVLAFMRVLQRTAAGGLAGRATTYVLGTAVISLFLGAIAVLDAEQDAPDANIRTFGDALWWATTTVTTVGYGDHYPVTFAGRLLAVALMLVGIGAVGVVTAALATWLLSDVRDEQRGTGTGTGS